MTVAFIEHYPATLHPVDEAGDLDTSVSIEVFHLRPTDTAELIEWSGVAGYPGADGGVLLLDDGQVIGQVQLGQFLIRDGGALRVEVSAPDLFAAYQPAPPS